MISCPKCGELNGDNSSTCFRCGAVFPTRADYKKICPKCGQIFDARQDYCTDCPDMRLSVYTGEQEYSGGASRSRGEIWMYIVGVLIPIVGIILGCVYIARGDDDLGKSVLLTSIFVPFIIGIVFMVLGNLFL